MLHLGFWDGHIAGESCSINGFIPPILHPSPFAFFHPQACWEADRCMFTSTPMYLAPSQDPVLFPWLHYHTLGSSTNYFRNYRVYKVLKGVINTYRCPQYHMNIGQAYKKNEGEGLGIELINEFTVQNSNHKCSTCVGSCQWHVLNVSCGYGLVTSQSVQACEWQLNISS